MINHFLVSLVCLSVLHADELDLNEAGSHSWMFEYVLEFYPESDDAEAHFKANLKNVTGDELRVMVNDKAFHATLEIFDGSGGKVEAYIKSYRTLLLTSIWFEPIITMRSKESISWSVPLNSLLTLHGKPVTHEFLASRKVVSEMSMAVVPESGDFMSGNATERSKPITIPLK